MPNDEFAAEVQAYLPVEAGGEVLDLEGRRLEMDFDISSRSNLMVIGDENVLEVLG